MKKLKDFKFLLVFAILIIGTIITIYDTFAKTSRVDKLEEKVNRVDNVLCGMAIDFKWTKASEACKK